MAKVNSIIKIEGTVEDLTFYKKDGVNFVRRKGGVSKERIGNDPNFIRTERIIPNSDTVAAAGKCCAVRWEQWCLRLKTVSCRAACWV